jgi:type III restriction enzyme
MRWSPSGARPPFRRRRVAVAGLLLGSCVLLGGAVIVVVKIVYTPTVEVPVLNDTTSTVTLSGCASDIVTLAPGQRAVLDPNLGDPRAACYMYLGQQIAASGGNGRLARKRLDVVEDPTSPTGLRLVLADAADIINASTPELPLGNVVSSLKSGILAVEFIDAARRADLNAARRLAEVLVDGAGGAERVAPYVNQTLAAVQRMLRQQYRAAPEVVERTVTTTTFAPSRTSGRPVEPNRYGKFSRGVAYSSWSDRALHPLNWFDSETERRFANLLDGAAEVTVWARIQRGEFDVEWEGGRYSPDFYAHINEIHYLLEVKGDDRIGDELVQRKRAAAEQWARHITDDGQHGDWQYLLVPEHVVKEARTLQDALGRSRAALG